MTDAELDGPERTVYRLDDDCTPDDITEGAYYHATVDATVPYGMFVELAPAVSGLAHESNYQGSYEEGEEVIVELSAIREDGDLSFAPVDPPTYETVDIHHTHDIVQVSNLDDHEAETVHLHAEVVQIKQTSGPTLFHAGDPTGVVPCAAFERAGVRAYPDIEVGDLVHVVGEVEKGGHGLQIETEAISELDADRAETVREHHENALADLAAPESADPLIEWEALEDLRPGLEAVADRIRRAVLANRPVVIRHHADTDGMSAGIPLERAVERFIERTHWDPEATRHLKKRLPSKAPYYEVEDATRDLEHALENRTRHGQRLPLFVMIDNGSTAEDVPAYKHLDTYGVPVVVIDHHSPDPDAVAPYVEEHVNPYLEGYDYRVTSGMLSVELARMIEPGLTDDLRHVPAVAGLADRSAADAMGDYLALAEEAGYDQADLRNVGDALDYAAHWLRYDAGRGVTDDVMGIGDPDRHEELVDLFGSRARRDIERQLDSALPHVESGELSSGVTYHTLDVERHAHRFTYPAPGTTTGAVHDHMVTRSDEPTITIGYGPDFAVLRSDGVRLDIPRMVDDLNAAFAGGGVSGGGHLVVGSIRFVKGMREEILDALIEEMGDAEIDESLGATAPRTYGSAASGDTE
jgi:RecJ-like exonuclease